MTKNTLQYIHLFIFTFSKEKKLITLFEETVSYYPQYNVGDDITFISSEERDIVDKPIEISTYSIKEIRSIITTDKTKKYVPQHTLYIRVLGKVEDATKEHEDVSEEYNESLDIDYLLVNINLN